MFHKVFQFFSDRSCFRCDSDCKKSHIFGLFCAVFILENSPLFLLPYQILTLWSVILEGKVPLSFGKFNPCGSELSPHCWTEEGMPSKHLPHPTILRYCGWADLFCSENFRKFRFMIDFCDFLIMSISLSSTDYYLQAWVSSSMHPWLVTSISGYMAWLLIGSAQNMICLDVSNVVCFLQVTEKQRMSDLLASCKTSGPRQVRTNSSLLQHLSPSALTLPQSLFFRPRLCLWAR